MPWDSLQYVIVVFPDHTHFNFKAVKYIQPPLYSKAVTQMLFLYYLLFLSMCFWVLCVWCLLCIVVLSVLYNFAIISLRTTELEFLCSLVVSFLVV